MRRWGRGLGAIAALLGLLVGVPAALVVLGEPLPRRWDTQALLDALLRPDDGTVLVHLLTLVGWAAWLVFALSVAAELVNLAVPARRFTLPGLAGVQRWAAGLMLSSLTVLAAGAPRPGVRRRSPPPRPGSPRSTRARPTEVHRCGSRHALRRSTRPRPGRKPWHRSRRTRRPRGRTAPTHAPTWCGAGTTSGRWPSATTAADGTGAGSPPPTRTCSPAVPTGWRSAGGSPSPGRTRARRRSVGRVRVRDGDTLTALAERAARRRPPLARDLRGERRPAHRPRRAPRRHHPPPARPPRAAPCPRGSRSHRSRRSRGPSGRAAVRRRGRPPRPRPDRRRRPHRPRRARRPARPPGPRRRPRPPSRSRATDERVDLPAALGLAAVGGLLAAGLVGGLAVRRRVQLQLRPVGRRIPPPPRRPGPLRW